MPRPYNKKQQGPTTYSEATNRWAAAEEGRGKGQEEEEEEEGLTGRRLRRGRHALQINCKNVYRQFSTQFYAMSKAGLAGCLARNFSKLGCA